ncbi:hypothetical protein K439DRAFT_1625095 [Ramaria rubella]|nr:hypothetical protein K439DRAFT_1625095 [Ramaria rubella]
MFDESLREKILSSIIVDSAHSKNIVDVFESRVSGKREHVQLAKYGSLEKVEAAFDVAEDAGGIVRLFWKGTHDEVVLDVQGYLVKHRLPPLPKGYRFAQNPLDVCQEVMLLAHGVHGFAQAQDSVTAIHSYMALNFRESHFQVLSEPMFGGVPALEF